MPIPIVVAMVGFSVTESARAGVTCPRLALMARCTPMSVVRSAAFRRLSENDPIAAMMTIMKADTAKHETSGRVRCWWAPGSRHFLQTLLAPQAWVQQVAQPVA